jgi:hypothetical protein
VYFAGHQFFARSGLAQNEHRSFRWGHHINLAANVAQGRALPDQVTKGRVLHHRLLLTRIPQFQAGIELWFNSGEVPHKRFVDFACRQVAFFDHGHLPCDRLVSGPQAV